MVAPKNPAGVNSPWPQLPLLRAGRFRGHAWEQFDLPWLTRDDWLFSPCNTTAMFKRRQLLFLHDAQPFAIPGNFTWSFRTWYRLLFGIAGRRAAAVLTNSEFSRNELVRLIGLSPSKLRVCLLGSEHTLRAAPDAATLAQRALPPGSFLLAVSSQSPNKNFAAVVRALELLGAAAPHCVIVGGDNARVFSQSQLDSARVHRLGYVSDGELAALYQRALALVFPSYYEGFGLPPLEAMAHGCPVILGDASSLPEVGGNAALYCDPADPRTLAAAIARLVDEPQLAPQLSHAGRERAATFTWQRAAGVLLDTLASASQEQQR